jgi:3'-5' exoribonuclease
MKSVFVNTLVPNETVTTHFLVIYKEVRQKKTGEPYLTLVLADRTGEIEAKMWDNVAEVMSTFDRDDFVKVKGFAQLYQNKHQFTVHKIRRAEDQEIEAADYFPCSKRNPDEMFAELMGIISAMRNEHLRKLLSAIFADEKLAALYRRAPAAKSIHHACLGGLIEHVLSLCGLCRAVAAHYPDLDLDLLLSAAILHDIGKVEELAYERSFTYTTSGQLLGHIIIGLQKLDDTIRGIPDFPPKLKLLLEHIILSHHGELEFGSPKVPVFAEALVFHHLDNLDSKFEAMRTAIGKDKNPENEFTGWVPALERVLLKKDLFLKPKVAPLKPPSAPESVPQPAQSAPQPAQSAPQPAQSSPEPARLSPFAEKLKAAL